MNTNEVPSTEVYIESYPLIANLLSCEEYRQKEHKEIPCKAKENGVFCYDISDITELFPHLKLRCGFRILAYIACEHHGTFGKVCALRDDASVEVPVDDFDFLAVMFGPQFSLPEDALPAINAIIPDGSAESFFEAALFSLFVRSIPYYQYKYEHWDLILPRPPKDFPDAWDVYGDISDWRPLVVFRDDGLRSVFFYCRRPETGVGASNGCDTIYRSYFIFKENPDASFSFTESRQGVACENEMSDFFNIRKLIESL